MLSPKDNKLLMIATFSIEDKLLLTEDNFSADNEMLSTEDSKLLIAIFLVRLKYCYLLKITTSTPDNKMLSTEDSKLLNFFYWNTAIYWR